MQASVLVLECAYHAKSLDFGQMVSKWLNDIKEFFTSSRTKEQRVVSNDKIVAKLKQRNSQGKGY